MRRCHLYYYKQKLAQPGQLSLILSLVLWFVVVFLAFVTRTKCNLELSALLTTSFTSKEMGV